MEPNILYEDESLMVLVKPAGWVVNDAQTTQNFETIQSWIKKNYDFETAKSEEFRSGIVHRLDKDTSGVILIAKTKKSFEDLQQQFKERGVEKKYLVLVHGLVGEGSAEIAMPVGRLPWNRERFGILPGGRDAVTKYILVSNYEREGKSYSLLEVYPKTGRTHQIRIHLKYLGHPVVSDSFYAGRKTARDDKSWCPRLFLHAQKIKFIHPESRKEISFASILPKDLEDALSNLQKI